MNTYTKLKDGSWGVRVAGPAPSPGALVTVTKKDGSTKGERIRAVLWTGTDKEGHRIALCSLEASADKAPASGGGSPSRRRSCACSEGGCCSPCRCGPECNCRGGPIYDC